MIPPLRSGGASLATLGRHWLGTRCKDGWRGDIGPNFGGLTAAATQAKTEK
jgi:hypothetical protein